MIKSDKERIKELFDMFLEDMKQLTCLDRFREFIFVFHNYINEFLDKMIVKFFINDKRTLLFKENFSLNFKRKIEILNNCNLIPPKFFNVLDDFNTIRNKVAHNVNWLEAIEQRKKPLIKHDKDSLYTMAVGIFGLLDICYELTDLEELVRNTKLNELNKEFENGDFSHWFISNHNQ